MHAPVTTTSSRREAAGETNGRRRPTWGEVAATGNGPSKPNRPPAPPATIAGRDPAARRSSATGIGRGTAVLAAGAPAPTLVTGPDDDPLVPKCDYDERHRRILDFRLPGLDGKPVRFQDLDADLVLIDFWGTWCPPCLQSIPHLVDLQNRMGTRLKVVGVACEQDGPKTAAPRVSETVRKLKINYPMLLSRNDGSCPLQKAMHIAAFPTMVLVDRQGRVVWRDQGATPATLARLDRILALPPEGQARR
jgi:thiol-disulfide isomerase/thioredoxin